MPYLALFLILYCFLKTFYYGIYEIKQKQNKPGGIAVCLFAILRTYLSEHYVICFLYHLIAFLKCKLSVAFLIFAKCKLKLTLFFANQNSHCLFDKIL